MLRRYMSPGRAAMRAAWKFPPAATAMVFPAAEHIGRVDVHARQRWFCRRHDGRNEQTGEGKNESSYREHGPHPTPSAGPSGCTGGLLSGSCKMHNQVMSANGGIVPFFTAPSSGETPSRRLLLVSHSFPPDASIGALRWQKLASAAFARDWGIDVIMMDPAESPLREDSRLRELPAGTRLYGVATRELLLERWQRSAIRLRNQMRDTRALSTATGRSAVRSAGLHLERSTRSIRSGLTALKQTYLARMFFNRWSDWADRAARLGVSL